MIWSDHGCLKPFSTIFQLNRGGSDGIEINNRLLDMTCTCTCKVHALVFIVLMKLRKVEFSTTFFSAGKGNINILTLEKTEGAINNRPSRETCSVEHKTQKTILFQIFNKNEKQKIPHCRNNTVGTIPRSNINIVERCKIYTFKTQIHVVKVIYIRS